MSGASAPLRFRKVDPPQDAESEQAGYGAALSFGPLDDDKPERTMSRNSCSAASKARKPSTTTWTGTVDDIPVRNNCHPFIHTPPHDYRAACYRASNHAAYSDILFLSPPVTSQSSHHTRRHSLGYSQGVQTFGELPFAHHASAGPAIGLVSTFPLRGHASLQFNGQAENHEGTSWSDRASGQTIDSQLSWSSSSNPVMGSENIRRSKDLSIIRSFCVEATMNTTAAHVFHDSAIGMTSGGIDDYGGIHPVSDPSIDSNLPSLSISDGAPSPDEPHTFKGLYDARGGSSAKPPGPALAADHPYERTTNVHQLRDRTIACGWINPDGMVCNKPIDYHCEGHFATAHGITKLPSVVKIECRWCTASARKEVKRKGFIRHVREAHMKYQRTEKRGVRAPWKGRRRRSHQ
ncbi:hypothetical protein BKA82DRAFT_1007480 [Pisolithus tinctorius]|uniref:Uncharacterized protein n=1 Tax=Pisolithus tinctorius Marx 270 TaxID=870435 RepID=A0A0C3NID2_PISTI|nr:hypothetical protein BKA82DRAFT_1007480 [Pisolithus tinctorius]KIN95440.1 hypothetical protein M404DRAFT_1007480 [Pisolithus tinctorius Marx 270]